jgi:hypothetical protein
MYLIDESNCVGLQSTHDLEKDQTLRRQLHHVSGLAELALPSPSSHIESRQTLSIGCRSVFNYHLYRRHLSQDYPFNPLLLQPGSGSCLLALQHHVLGLDAQSFDAYRSACASHQTDCQLS